MPYDDSPYEWDETKQHANLGKHQVDFSTMAAFDWDNAIIESDDRHDEPRWLAYDYIGDALYVVVFTERGEKTRIISLREASQQEVIDYG